MEAWVADLDSWDVCDGVCGNLFDRTPFALDKAVEWSAREPEFEKRAGFALMAWAAVHRKDLPDAAFASLLPADPRAGDRRPQLREEGGLLGAAADRQAQRRAQRPGHPDRRADRADGRPIRQVDRPRRPARASERRRPGAPRAALTYSSSRAGASSRSCGRHGSSSSSATTWTQTWSAPASRCWRTRTRDAVDVAPRDHGVDQGVAPLAGDSRRRSTHAPEVARVVLGLQVVEREPPGDAPGLGRIALEHDGLLHREDRARTEPLPRERGVLDRHEVRVDSVGALGGELEHPRPERREHQPRRPRARAPTTARGPSRRGSHASPRSAARTCLRGARPSPRGSPRSRGRTAPGRHPRASASPLAIAVGSRAQMFAIPLATTARPVLERIHAAWENASRLSTASGIQIAR